MSILQQGIGSILSNYADVIEGGNAYRGSGTSYAGIPGTRSLDRNPQSGLVTTGGSLNTVVVVASDADNLVRADTPPFFLLCTAQAVGSGNVGAARKITAHSSGTFTVGIDFPEAVATGDTFSIVEGFKRQRDNWDIESEEAGSAGGFDRFFHIRATTGERIEYYGNNTEQYRTNMEVRLRLLKHSRALNVIDSGFENLLRIRSIITRGQFRGNMPGSNPRTLLLNAVGTEPEIEDEDDEKVVLVDNFDLVYRVDATFK